MNTKFCAVPAAHKISPQVLVEPQLPAPLRPHLLLHSEPNNKVATYDTIQKVIFEYPSEWKPPERFNNHSLFAATAARNAFQWLVDRHLIPPPSDPTYSYWFKCVESFNVQSYGGCSIVLGNYTWTLLHTKFILIWLLWDDMIVEVGPKSTDETMVHSQHFKNISDIVHGRRVRLAFQISNGIIIG